MTVAIQNTINAKHSMKSDEWYTPGDILTAMHSLFAGQFILDPASSQKADELVRANLYFDKEDDGLSLPWSKYTLQGRKPVSVFLNPPGGRGVCNIPLSRLFWEKLTQETQDGNILHAVYVAYSIEQLQSLQRFGIGCFPVCLPDRRIRYLKEQEDGTLKPMTSPTHAGAIVYVPGLHNDTSTFRDLFSQFGQVYNPC